MIRRSQCYCLDHGGSDRYFGFDEADHVWQAAEEAQYLGLDWTNDESRCGCVEAGVWDLGFL